MSAICCACRAGHGPLHPAAAPARCPARALAPKPSLRRARPSRASFFMPTKSFRIRVPCCGRHAGARREPQIYADITMLSPCHLLASGTAQAIAMRRAMLRARRPAAGRPRLVRIAARPHLRRVRGDRARGRLATPRFAFTPWDRTDAERRARRRRRSRPDDRQGVREGRGQRLDRRRQLLARVRARASPAPRTTRASSPPASASSRTWPTRTSPRCT